MSYVIVTAYEVELYFFESHHLKDKRRVLKSLIQRGRQRFGLSISEVDHLDHWQTGTIGLAIVSNSDSHNERIIDRFLKAIEEWYPVEITKLSRY
ncbi:DUF503 domain-containing protein [Dolosicoccus paucivorans]|uniref:DUF503 domain-containing protein n=2 Tax=Dolosicoccus paucivorans TaxID=84521 RepID=A0A2N6SPQ0_9LACT|nr:DUF503 domain-containing protein [Dolosicoccus paucivorans]PMB84417.1 DUF503 domain-containing protein [Dolosicoccus paucivorans]PMC59054.1 DUF503 domain-containing protein [Dolosicoccus paucivorans]